MMLADMGAQVIRVDRPTAAPAPYDPLLRGRHHLTLDLKHPDGVAAVLRLVDWAEVLVEGYRPGVAERLGVGPEVCSARNPRLIYGRITGWGQSGPLAHKAGHDLNYLALSGLLQQIGPLGGKPVPPLNVIADYGGGGLLLAFGVLCALRERERSGRGQVVDTAMVDGAASFMAASYGLQARGLWKDTPGRNFLTGGAHFYDTYATRDGKWVAVAAIEPQFHAQLLARLGLDPAEFAAGVGFEGAPYDALLDTIWPPLRERLAAAIRQHSRDELEQLFAEADACVTPVLGMHEAMQHPHNVARQTFVEVDGQWQNAPAPRFSRTPAAVPHTPGTAAETVLQLSGFTPAEIGQLRDSGALSE